MPRKYKSKKTENLDSGIPALIGRQVKRRRIEKGLTLRGLAEKTGVSASTILRCEEGTYQTQERLIKRIAEVLGCELDELYEDDYAETMVIKRALTPAQRKLLILCDEYGDEVMDLAFEFIRAIKEGE